MKNFVFLSPNFPTNYWMFCRELKNNGLRVLGIGDAPYDDLTQELKDSLDEYYKVSSLMNYEEVFKAVAFFTFKYGKIDWLESNNEFWLERDAMLRTEFNITSGFKSEDMTAVKFKSEMKKYYQAVGIPTARYYLVENWDGCKNFINEVGYPVIAKPDNGVGASDTFKIKSDEELARFFEKKADCLYIMEEYITGRVISYDAIVDSKGNVIFETGNVTPSNLVDTVNEAQDSCFYIRKELPEKVRDAGRRTLKSFGVHSRFVHFEFFELGEDQPMGKAGDVVALEVNMRPSGGVTPDMINFAHSTNVYKVWADMVAFDGSAIAESGDHHFCAFAGRRNYKNHAMSHEDVLNAYGSKMMMHKEVDAALSGAMADYMYVADFDTEDEVYAFYNEVLREA